MMSELNSMLEHLRMNQLKKIKKEAQSVIPTIATPSAAKKKATIINDENDFVSDQPKNDDIIEKTRKTVSDEMRKKSLKEIPSGMINIIEQDKAFDPRKRYSIGNGDVRFNGKSMSIKNQQRKLSADMRLRGSNNQLNDEHFARRPVRLRSMCNNFEVYDSLHIKAIDVSVTKHFSRTKSNFKMKKKKSFFF